MRTRVASATRRNYCQTPMAFLCSDAPSMGAFDSGRHDGFPRCNGIQNQTRHRGSRTENSKWVNKISGNKAFCVRTKDGRRKSYVKKVSVADWRRVSPVRTQATSTGFMRVLSAVNDVGFFCCVAAT